MSPGVRRIIFGGSSLTSTARTIINEVDARRGASMTQAQKKAIDSFIRAETTAGRWGTVLKRFYLPGWANASANAYDWVSGAVGTYSGFGAGDFINGGTTGGVGKYFDFGVTPGELGMTTSSGLIGTLIYTRPAFTGNQSSISSYNSSTSTLALAEDTINLYPFIYSTPLSGVALSAANRRGIITLSRTSTTTVGFRKRNQSGVSSYVYGAGLGTVPTAKIFAHCTNVNDTTQTEYYTGTLGAYFAGLGMDDANADAFTANLKTLWETLYGLTLP